MNEEKIYKFAVGFLLIDAPHSALNMFGNRPGTGDKNEIIVKKLKKGKDLYPYISSQAWRYWLRNTLERKFGWDLSPLEKVEGKNQVYTSANPIKYKDDDVFGYMRAIKKEKKVKIKDKKNKEKTKNIKLDITVTRTSPLKNTPLVSVFSIKNSLTKDEAYASRHEGDPVPYSSEFYSTVFKGAFSLDLDSVGRFSIKNKSGYRNLISEKEIPDELEDVKQEYELLKEEAKKLKSHIDENEWVLDLEIRKKRAVETIKALKYLSGGAKLTEYLTDVTPKFIILGMFGGGINPFISDIVYEKDGNILLDKDVLISRLLEFKDVLNPKKIFIGKDKGFMRDWDSLLESVATNENEEKKQKETNVNKEGDFDKLKKEGIEIVVTTVGEAIDGFAKEIEKYYE